MLRDETPYVCGRPPALPTRVYCARCKLKTLVTAAMWARIPELTGTQLEEMGLLDFVARDYTLGGLFTIEKARDFVRAGRTLEEVREIGRETPAPPPAPPERPAPPPGA